MGNTSFLTKAATVIVKKRKIIFIIFIAIAIFSAFSRNWVSVNDSLSDYLNESTDTRKGLTVMDREFTTFATAKVMVDNITLDDAEAICTKLERIEGVQTVDFDDTDKHYHSASALYSITFDGLDNDEISLQALDEVKDDLSNYDVYIDTNVGNPLKKIIDKEMLIVDGIAVLIIISVLLLTSRTYGEIPVLLLTFGSAALMNMGTNFLMGEISFVTDSIAIVLQLALAIDYAIILCHRYMDEHETKPAEEAAIAALTKAIPEISASSLTTVSGMLALCFMNYQLGLDIGSVLIKAIILSLISVFLLMPGLLVMFSDIIDKTHHKSFVPKIDFLGKFSYKTRMFVPFIFLAIIICAFIFSGKVNYVYDQYSVDSIRHNDTQKALQRIDDTFGDELQMAVIIPKGDYEAQSRMIKELEEIPVVNSVTGLANVEAMDGYMLTDALDTRQFASMTGLDNEVVQVLYAAYALDNEEYKRMVTDINSYQVPIIDIFTYLLDNRGDYAIELDEEIEDKLNDLEEELNNAKLQLESENYSRIVLMLDMPVEGDESYANLNIIKGIVAKYADEYYVVGDTTSCADLRSTFERDNILISVLSALFVIIVLIFTFKSSGLSLLLICVIQGSIWCNFSIPFLKNQDVFFLTYLIISAIQMGANIDYAIVISSHYMELRGKVEPKKIMVQTLNEVFPTIITSGTMLCSAGFIIALVATNETISAIGIYLGIGTLISIILVMCVLPQVLLLGDTIIGKTAFTINTRDRLQRSGSIRLNGRVKGHIEGEIDAEIHGVLKGDINAVLTRAGDGHGNAEDDTQVVEAEDVSNE